MMKDRFILPRLNRPGAVDRLLETVMNLPLEKAWLVKIEAYQLPRTNDANAYYWGPVLDTVSNHTGYEKTEAHEEFCRRFFGTMTKRVPKTPHNPSGIKDAPIRTTTHDEHGNRDVLPIGKFAEFVDFVIRFAAQEIGVAVPPPDKDYRKHRKEAA